jgi:preprotein translocase subunit SecG
MSVLISLVFVLQVLAGLIMIGLILMQHGKGADMGASFGTGSAGSLFGASGSANFLSRSTAVFATVFFICTLVLAHDASQRHQLGGDGGPLTKPAIQQRAASAVVPGASAARPVAASGAVASTPAR